MNFRTLYDAIEANRGAFANHRADGKVHQIPHQDFISFSTRWVIAIAIAIVSTDRRTQFHTLFTMTDLSVGTPEVA